MQMENLCRQSCDMTWTLVVESSREDEAAVGLAETLMLEYHTKVVGLSVFTTDNREY